MPYLLAPLPRERWRRRSSAPVEPLPLLLPSSISSPIPMPATLLQPRRAVSPTAWLRSGGLTGGHTFFSHPTRSLASCSLARAARRRPPSSTPPAPPRPQTAPPLSCLAPLPRAMTETGRRSGGRSGRSCDFRLRLAQIALLSRYSESFSTKAVSGGLWRSFAQNSFRSCWRSCAKRTLQAYCSKPPTENSCCQKKNTEKSITRKHFFNKRTCVPASSPKSCLP